MTADADSQPSRSTISTSRLCEEVLRPLQNFVTGGPHDNTPHRSLFHRMMFRADDARSENATMALWALTHRMGYIASLQSPSCEDKAAIILQGVLQLNPRLDEPAPLLPLVWMMDDQRPAWTHRKQTALFAAAASGLTNHVVALLDAGANPTGIQGYRPHGPSGARASAELPCKHGSCRLDFAAIHCRVPVAAHVHAVPPEAQHADLVRMWWYKEVASYAPSSPLDVAIQRDNHAVARLLLNRTSSPSKQLDQSTPSLEANMPDMWLSTIAAVHHSRPDIVNALVKQPGAAEVVSRGCVQDKPVIGTSPLTWTPLLYAGSRAPALDLKCNMRSGLCKVAGAAQAQIAAEGPAEEILRMLVTLHNQHQQQQQQQTATTASDSAVMLASSWTVVNGQAIDTSVRVLLSITPLGALAVLWAARRCLVGRLGHVSPAPRAARRRRKQRDHVQAAAPPQQPNQPEEPEQPEQPKQSKERSQAFRSLWGWWRSKFLPAADPGGIAYRDAYLMHILCLGLSPLLWQVMTRVAADETAIKCIAQPYTGITFVFVIARVFIHESVASDADLRMFVGLFTATSLLVYVTGSLYFGEPLNFGEPLPLWAAAASLANLGTGDSITDTFDLWRTTDMTDCVHDGKLIYLLEVPHIAVVGIAVGLDLFRVPSGMPCAALCVFFMVFFLANTLRECGPRRLKCGFHAQLSPLGIALFVAAMWLAFIVGLRVGAERHRCGFQRLAASRAAALPSRDELLGKDWDRSLTCSITCERFVDPVMAPDGHTYERAALEQWLSSSNTSPMTGKPMPEGELRTSYAIRSLLDAVAPAE